jgi:hypothetical protein
MRLKMAFEATVYKIQLYIDSPEATGVQFELGSPVAFLHLLYQSLADLLGEALT